jgi:hypothetical protein
MIDVLESMFDQFRRHQHGFKCATVWLSDGTSPPSRGHLYQQQLPCGRTPKLLEVVEKRWHVLHVAETTGLKNCGVLR